MFVIVALNSLENFVKVSSYLHIIMHWLDLPATKASNLKTQCEVLPIYPSEAQMQDYL